MRLLVVDDDAMFRQELADLLEQDGHSAEVAPSVPKALEHLEAGSFDLVLTDLRMPRHGGMELLREIRSRWPRLLVVMITGFATIDTAVEAMKLGAFDFLRKPFTPAQLQQTLALAAEEFRFQGPAAPPALLEEVVRRWTLDGLSVLLVSDVEVPPRSGVVTLKLPGDPRLIRDAIEAFLPAHPRPGVILHGADRIFDGPRRGEFHRFIETLAPRIPESGRLLVAYNPARLTQDEVDAIRATVSGPLTQSTLEALSNPIRRAVLSRAGEGPITFTQALESARLDDSPKLSFHLRRLQDAGLLGRQENEYRITQLGSEALRLLAQWDAAAGAGIGASGVLPVSG